MLSRTLLPIALFYEEIRYEEKKNEYTVFTCYFESYGQGFLLILCNLRVLYRMLFVLEYFLAFYTCGYFLPCQI